MRARAIFSEWLIEINPTILAIGFDNWNMHLNSPTLDEVELLISKLTNAGIKVHRKWVNEPKTIDKKIEYDQVDSFFR